MPMQAASSPPGRTYIGESARAGRVKKIALNTPAMATDISITNIRLSSLTLEGYLFIVVLSFSRLKRRGSAFIYPASPSKNKKAGPLGRA
jgi:hypothetical protein